MFLYKAILQDCFNLCYLNMLNVLYKKWWMEGTKRFLSQNWKTWPLCHEKNKYKKLHPMACWHLSTHLQIHVHKYSDIFFKDVLNMLDVPTCIFRIRILIHLEIQKKKTFKIFTCSVLLFWFFLLWDIVRLVVGSSL